VDAPPCLGVSDARILARYAAGVLLVLRANFADRKAALAAAQRLMLDGIPVLGTVLNDWDPMGSGDPYGSSNYSKAYI
jgi:polysaccharide biosynthesis transport protein